MSQDEFKVYTVKDKSVLDSDSGDEIDESSNVDAKNDDNDEETIAGSAYKFEGPSYKVASDYMNEEEMAAFKKPKKRLKKDRLRKPIAEAFGETGESSLKKPRLINDEPEEGELPDDSDNVQSFEDDLEKEMRAELEKVIKLKQKQIQERKLPDAPQADEESDSDSSEESDPQNSGICFDATAEYCRNLSHIAAESVNVNQTAIQNHSSFDDDLSHELGTSHGVKREHPDGSDEDSNSKSGAGQWSEVDMDEERKRPRPHVIKSKPIIESNPILEEEPDLRRSVANALRYAIQKGYLERETKKLTGAKASSRSYLEAQSYTIEEKFRDNDDGKKRGRRDRPSSSSSQLQPVKLPDNFNPDNIQIKLEYTDDSGQELNTKEAFRYLSHKFHGKGPGLNKQDKRLKKMEREAQIKQMTSSDTPLGTASLMMQKQKELQQPYLELDGL